MRVHAGGLRHPVDAYRAFVAHARSAARREGDYPKTVLNAAIASEILLKAAAWMLTFEASTLTNDPAPSARTDALGTLKPSQLIGSVLQPRLGGSWISNNAAVPVGAWRQHIARVRSEILHRERRVLTDDADNALAALGEIERHVIDRIAAAASTYPRTAYALAGPVGLRRRGREDAALELLRDATDSPNDWIRRYSQWLDGMLGDFADTDA